MMKHNLKYLVYIILIVICPALSFAQNVTPKTSGQSAEASLEEIKKARKAVEDNPDSLSAHHAYIKLVGLKNLLLVHQYELWMKKYPGNVSIPLTIGTRFYNAEMPEAKAFLLKVVAMEPENAKAWYMLWADASRWGQEDLSTEYIRKAALVEPLNVNYAYYYLSSFEDSNPDDYKQKVFDFVKRFPTSERGAQALYWLGVRSTNLNDRISYLEELRKLYPPQKFNWSLSGMKGLADAYLQTDPEKALVLINGIAEEKDWTLRKHVAESLININKLEQNQKYKEAIVELGNIKLPKFNYLNDFVVLRKYALQEKVGDIRTAYDSVAVRFAARPTDQLYTVLELYGKKIGKDKEQVATDIRAIRKRTAVPAYPFELGLYTNNDKLKLKDLKGKVVLLTFWFPGCGPCRAEFPHFQTVINEFKGEDVVYVGINVTPEQDPYVVPFMENTKYSFIPLRGTAEFASKNYGVRAQPENFLIDQDGNIVFKDFSIDHTNHRTLELMISSLLNKEQKGK